MVLATGRAKAELHLPVSDPAREAEVIRRAVEEARARGVDEEMVRDVIWRVIASARKVQEEEGLSRPSRDEQDLSRPSRETEAYPRPKPVGGRPIPPDREEAGLSGPSRSEILKHNG